MKITDIKQQVKNPERYSIYVDGKFCFGLSEAGLLASGIRVGNEYTSSELDALKDTARRDKAYNQALGLIARRPRSVWEIETYLRRKEYDKGITEEVLQRLSSAGWLDDHDFARKWVDNRRLLKQTSKRRLQQELRAKRVSDEAIQGALSEDDTDERVVLADLAKRKYAQTRYQDQTKLMQYLLRQGFNYEDVKVVVQEIFSSQD